MRRLVKLLALLCAVMLASTLFVPAAGAAPYLKWQAPTPQGNRIRDVAFGGGLYVAVGAQGTILTSSDGAMWLLQATGTRHALHGVAYGNGWFVAVGEGGMIRASQDGIHWRTRISGIYQNLNDVIYANETFTAVGDEGTILHSPDGVAWERQELATQENLSGIAYGNGRYMAVMGDEKVRNTLSTQRVQMTVVTSADGRTWAPRQARLRNMLTWSAGDSEVPSMYGITFADGRFIAVGGKGTILSSRDGDAWVEHTVQEPSGKRLARTLFAVTAADGYLLMAGERGLILSGPSPDELDVQSAQTDQNLFAIAAGAQGYVAAGRAGVVLSSPDGADWTLRTTAPAPAVTGIAHGAGRYVATLASPAPEGLVAISTDGVHWRHQRIAGAGALRGVTYGAGLFVAVGDQMATSADGISWAVVEAPGPLMAVTYAGERFVAVGHEGLVVTSRDGKDWTPLSIGTKRSLHAIAYAGGRYVVVGESGLVVTSATTQSWMPQWSGAEDDLYAIIYANGRFVAVGDTTVATSADGINWSARSELLMGARSIAYGGGWYVVTGTDRNEWDAGIARGQVYASLDAQTWVKRPVTEPVLTTVAYLNGQFFAGGHDGTIVTLAEGSTLHPTCGLAFEDVPGASPACAAVEFLSQRQVVGGYPDGTFQPDRDITRAEFAKMLTLAMKWRPMPDQALPFADVAGHWAAKQGYLQAARAAKVIDGFPGGGFRPNALLTRAQLVKMAAAAAGLSPSGAAPYTDIGSGAWYAGWVAVAYENRMIGPSGRWAVWADATFGGDQPASREEAAMVLANLMAR